VPLSEHEQRMLRQIERQFQHDRGLARTLRIPADSKQAVHNSKLGALGFVVGLVLVVVSFATSWIVGLVGFLVMVVSVVALVQSLRRLLQDRWGDPSASLHEPGMHDGLGNHGGAPRSEPGGKWWAGWGGPFPRHDGQDDAP
jgi:hypothetical protein